MSYFLPTVCLHLHCTAGGAWRDVAAAFYHEAQLRRAHPSFSQPPGLREGLLASAEVAVRSGLRLEPASPELWTALGTVAVEVGVLCCALLGAQLGGGVEGRGVALCWACLPAGPATR